MGIGHMAADLPEEVGGWVGWSSDNQWEINRGWVRKADTIEGLAALMHEFDDKIDEAMLTANLRETIGAYNSYCTDGVDPDFGRSADTLLPVSTPPYYAIPIFPGLCSTAGGPRKNVNGEVVDVDGKCLRAPYAAGTVSETYGFTYGVTGGNGADFRIWGRICARNAAALKDWE